MVSLPNVRLNAFDLAAPVALYCGADSTLEVWDIGADGQGRLAFTMSLDVLTVGEMGTGLGNHLYLLDNGEAELTAFDLMGL